jgi:Ca2+-binding EF-hand superfamily protein
MDSFERREAKLRAVKRWAVVRKSVLPTKDEFMNKANRGKKDWVHHWQKRNKPASMDSIMKHMLLNVRDHQEEIKDLFIQFTEGQRHGKGPKSRRIPEWRQAPKVSLVAIFHMMELELTKEEVLELIDYFLDRTNSVATNYHEFVWVVKSYTRMRAHHKKKIKDEIEAKKAAPPAGEWKGWKDRTTGKNKYIWVVKTKENKAKRQREGVEAAVDEVMDKIRNIAKKNKNFNLKVAFEKFDVNGDGTIEHQELQNILREIGIELTAHEMDVVFERFDPDGGGIEYEEFTWVFMNRRALKKAAQGKASNMGAPKTSKKTLPPIDPNSSIASSGGRSAKSGGSMIIDDPQNNLAVRSPKGRRSLKGVRSQSSLSRTKSMSMAGNSMTKSSASLPPLQLDTLKSVAGGGSVLGNTLGASQTMVEKPKVTLGESGAMLKARILSAWCQSEGDLPQDSVRVERAADICMAKIREISMVDDKFDLKRAFKRFDIDGNGVVDKNEFVQAMRSFDNTLTPIECLAAYKRFDPDGDDVINYEEFSWTFFNRRTFSEASKKLKRRFANQIQGRREAAQAKTRIALQLEAFFQDPRCSKIFKEYQNKERLHDITSLYACLFQLPLNFTRKEVGLMLDQVRDSLRMAVSFPQFRQICKNQRRDASVARQAIDENLGKFKDKGKLTKFNAPVCRVDDRGENDAETERLLSIQKKL